MTEQMILFRRLSKDIDCAGLMDDMASLAEYCDAAADADADDGLKKLQEKARALAASVTGRLLTIAEEDAFTGNLWQVYCTLILVNHENAYTLSAERRGEVSSDITKAMLSDLELFHAMFSYDLNRMASTLRVPVMEAAASFSTPAARPAHYSTSIRDAIAALCEKLSQAKDAEEMLQYLNEFYRAYGVGSLGLHKAFRLEGGKSEHRRLTIAPVRNIRHVSLDDLVGYEIAKEALLYNTKAFVEGRSANNCLLYGDAGTGKSTSIKAIANQFFADGLRVIEVYKHQFKDIHDVVGRLKTRNYKFILYLDDLSFEDFETEYKYLKAVIEGGLEKRPDNILIYATSNRRHLIRENFSDKASLDDDDIRHSDTVQEKLSLANRFGVAIYFGPPTRKDYNEIVKTLAARNGIRMPEEELIAEATKWEMAHGGLSGRCAQQFIDYLSGEE